MKVEFRITSPTMERIMREHGLPVRGSSGSAGYDLRADVPGTVVIRPQERLTIGTGLAVHIADPGFFGFVAPRSGLGSRGLGLANTIGVIDSDYTGEIICNAVNRNAPGGDDIVIEPGDRVFQLLFVPVALPGLVLVDAFSAATERGEGGFGSTGR